MYNVKVLIYKLFYSDGIEIENNSFLKDYTVSKSDKTIKYRINLENNIKYWLKIKYNSYSIFNNPKIK